MVTISIFYETLIEQLPCLLDRSM